MPIHCSRDRVPRRLWLSAQGIQPDEEKINAVLNTPKPTDKSGILRIMGMINLIGKFIPNLLAKTTYLRELLRKDNNFDWTANHEREWQKLKDALTATPALTFFVPSKGIKVSTGASKDGLGVALLQAEGEHWKPVAYASKSMTETE